MNIRFPKAQHSIAELDQVLRAFLVPSNILALYLRKRAVSCGVAVPKVPIPLNDDLCIWQKNIDQEFAANQLLLKKRYIHVEQQLTTSHFERGWRKQFSALHALHCTDIAAFIRAIVGGCGFDVRRRTLELFATDGAIQRFGYTSAFMRAIERLVIGACLLAVLFFTAISTRHDFASTAFLHFLCAVLLATCCTLLPFVGAFWRAKAAASVGVRHIDNWLTALLTVFRFAWNTDLLTARGRFVLLPATGANFNFRLIVHVVIIPWSFAQCK